MFWKTNRKDISNALTATAASIVESDEAFRRQAREAAQKLDPRSIKEFRRFFHNPPAKPEHLKEHFNGLGEWMAVCQFAAFEIIYNFRERALPTLREIAYGEYDWTQGNAIEILCRLASEGVERQKIIEELRREMPHMRYEALLYAAGPLIKQAGNNGAIRELLGELNVSDFDAAIKEVEAGEDAT